MIDTNVILAGLRSKKGASNLLLQMVDKNKYEIALSVPVILEYEEVIRRNADELPFTEEEIDALLGYLCKLGIQTEIFFLWRPTVRDEGDAKITEVAIAAGCDTIVTYNLRNFVEVRSFGIKVMTPKAFLIEIGVIS